MYERRNALQK